MRIVALAFVLAIGLAVITTICGSPAAALSPGINTLIFRAHSSLGDAVTHTAWAVTPIWTASSTTELTPCAWLPMVFNRWPPIPYKPTLNAIANADADNNYTVYWTEQPSHLADTYRLQEATDPAFTTNLRDVCTTWQQSCDVNGKLPGRYYYRVQGYNGWGYGEWSNIQNVVIYPLFVGLNLRWDGAGYIRVEEYYDVGTHVTRDLNGLTDADTIRSHNQYWYDPNPKNWESDTWDSFYSVSTGYFKSSSVPGDPSWKWGNPWILPYDWNFSNGQIFLIEGQAFLVTGPHSGYTAFGKPVQYWRLVNRDTFLYWDAGGAWRQYVHPGDITLWYDAGNTRLCLHTDTLRRYYYQGNLTSYTVQYIDNLTASNSFPTAERASQDITYLGVPPFQPDYAQKTETARTDRSLQAPISQR